MTKDPDCPSAVAVRRLLDAAGMKAVQCARLSGLRQAEISKLRCGKLKARSARVRDGLALAFGTTAEEMTRILSGGGGVIFPKTETAKSKRRAKKASA